MLEYSSPLSTSSSKSPRLLALLLCCLLLSSPSGCSTNRSDKGGNSVGQYDPEFDSTPEKSAEAEAVPNIDEEIELLNEGMKAYDGGLYSLAKTSFTSLQEKYPSSYYSAFAELKAADAEFQLGNYTEALESYQDFLRLRPKHEAVPYVMFQVAETYRLQYRGPANDQSPLRTAIKHYQSLIELYPENSFSALARRGIVASREQLALHESAVARFYLKQGEKRSAAHRFKRLIGTYADTAPGRSAQSAVYTYFKDEPKLLDYITSQELSVKEVPKIKDYQPSMPKGVSLEDSRASVAALSQTYRNSFPPKETVPTDRASANVESKSQQSTRGLLSPSTTVKETPREVQSDNTLRTLLCEEDSELAYVTLGLKKMTAFKVQKIRSDAVDIVLHQVAKQLRTSERDNQTQLECQSEHLRARLYRNSSSELVLRVTASDEIEYRVLSLDRPDRLLVVVLP